ncbi:DUF3592 domain-containing protein [Streptomyces sp. NPDC057413]|uniref:DUF3592 domain-containing protein n=1 Tax=Streptomyces sp. NPDC057413 TaxID=3346124 RepID=UPI0036CB4D5D
MRPEWLFSLIPLTIGAVFLAFGLYGLRRAAALRERGVTTRGRIVRHEIHRSDEGARYHHPVATWTTEDGSPCTHRSRFGRGRVTPGFAPGAEVMIRYDPTNPARFTIQGWDTATVDRLFTALGAGLVAATLAVLLIRALTL